jgi:esterase/lipase superfamily enzyme
MMIVLCFVTASICGCEASLMTTPAAYRFGGEQLYDVVPESKRSASVKVFYATDRNVTTSTDPSRAYGNKRGRALRLGAIDVRLGSEGDTWENLKNRSASGHSIPARLTSFEEYGTMWTVDPTLRAENFNSALEASFGDHPAHAPAVQFINAINDQLTDSVESDVIVYVPGYNTPFADPVKLMAQLHHYLGRIDAMIVFSWPVQTHPFSYSKDRASGHVSVRALRELLDLLADQSEARRIHVISYSAGARLVTQALLQLRLTYADEEPEEIETAQRIGNVIYAGADEDIDLFRNALADRFQDVADRVTVYTSEADRGLGMAEAFVFGAPRLGRSAKGLMEEDLEGLRRFGTDSAFVSVERAKKHAGAGGIYAHGYWYQNAWVLNDLIMMLRLNLSPADRGLVRGEEEAFWSFPDDYPARIRSIVDERFQATLER